MFKKSENLKCSNMVNSNMVALKYGCVQIRLRSNTVAFKYGFEREHRTLREWLRTHSPRVENNGNTDYFETVKDNPSSSFC